MDTGWTEDDILTDIKIEAQERWIKQEIREEDVLSEDLPQLIPFDVDDVFEDSVCRPKNSHSTEQVEDNSEQQNICDSVSTLATSIEQEVTNLSPTDELQTYSNIENGHVARLTCSLQREKRNSELDNNAFASVFIKTEIKEEKADSDYCRVDSSSNRSLSADFKKNLYVRLVQLNLDSVLDKLCQTRTKGVTWREASRKHLCKICPYSTNRIYHYKRHIATHMTFAQYAKSSTLYECNDCNYKTKQKYSLRRHLVTVHKSAYVCQKCNYETNSSEVFSLHLVSHHNNRLVYNCEKCDVSCCTKEQLKYHAKVHNLDKIILSCSECGFETKEMRCLDKHVLRHMHMRVGKLYKCELCPYKAKKRSSISRHVLTHEKDKKLQCNECGFKTNRKDTLVHHLRNHKTTK